jgi:hypothetical protein
VKVEQEALLEIRVAGDNCSFDGISTVRQSVEDFFSYTGTIIIEVRVTCRVVNGSDGLDGRRHLLQDEVGWGTLGRTRAM